MLKRIVMQYCLGIGFAAAILLSSTGCKMSCEADSDNDLEDVVDEIGDEIEDATDKK